jgi:glutamate---cysteine ligase / carboxylate-amine ligase
MERRHRFQRLTVGVEEEFLLVDPVSRIAVPRASQVRKLAAEDLDQRVTHEFYASQIECHTRPAAHGGELWQDLVEGRRALADAANRLDCLVVASGSAVLTSKPLPITEGARYERMARRYTAAATGADSESSACHIHVGDLETGEAVTLAGHLRPWLPVLQALAANSPFAGGAFRRCASWRHYEQQAWPTVGPTPPIPAGMYDHLAEDLVASGVLLDRGMIYWYARPSEHLPTLEIRVPDVNADVDVDLLAALLTRSLATVLLADARAGVPCPVMKDAAVREAHRQAAVRGLSGTWSHPRTGAAMPLSSGLQALVERVRPALKVLGEERLVERLLQRVARVGTGAQRQRTVYRRRRSLLDVVDDLAARTVMADTLV